MATGEINGATESRRANSPEKLALRQQMRRARDAMPAAERARQSREVCGRLAGLPEVRQANLVACYLAFGSELNLGPLMAAQAKKTRPSIALPLTLQGRRLAFVRLGNDEASHPESLPRCLREPASPLPEVPLELAGRVVGPRDIDVVMLPGLAFDLQGGRLGYGGGYYDAWLGEAARVQKSRRDNESGHPAVKTTAPLSREPTRGFGHNDESGRPMDHRPLLIGACFTCQLLPAGRALPHDPHDIPVDLVVWPNGCQRAKWGCPMASS